MADRPPLLWLDGAAALELAPRLEASGYRTISPPLPKEPNGSEREAPDAAILSPSCADRIPDLRLHWGALPILLGSALDDVEGRCQALSHGADDLWLTSAGPSDLLTRLRLNLQPPAPPPEEPLIVVGDLEMDPRHHTVTRAGRPVALTSREHQLLMLLLRHRPHVVSRERILREIWPEERGATSNVIEVYVRYLRRKLEEGGQSRLIHTVRGEGYCLRHTSPSPT
jgi:DNA-binding response OmpR family regulator